MILEDQKKQENTVGSRFKVNLAYIAGFLDGDGSLMLQIKKRADGKSKIRFMTTICFYQDTRHEKDLLWIRKILNIGYISRRNDGMTELRINGYSQVRDILYKIAPYIRFKRIQCKMLSKACKILSGKKYSKLSKLEISKLVDCILVIQSENYVAKRKRTKAEIYKILNLTP